MARETLSAADYRTLAAVKKPSKYRAVKATIKGEKFDSTREALRHLVLLDMQRRGEISDLRRQQDVILHINGKTICTYRADWEYFDRKRRRFVMEDAKGYQTPEFKLKWRLCQVLFPDYDWRLS